MTNKLNLVNFYKAGEVSALSLWLPFGSKHGAVLGSAHFLEHMLFKGNQSKSADQLSEELESLGGYINAFTTREETCLQMQVLNQQLPQALKLCTELLFETGFVEKELELERKVILQELKASHDTPEEVAEDFLYQTLWPESSFGGPIIGTKKTLREITREQLIKQHQEFYKEGHFALGCVSGLANEKVDRLIDKAFGGYLSHYKLPTKSASPPIKQSQGNWKIKVKKSRQELSQAYLCLAFELPAGKLLNPLQKVPYKAISYLLTEGLSARLFRELREKRGLVYFINSQLETHHEGNFFGISLSTSKNKTEQTVELIKRELEDILSIRPFTKQELNRAVNFMQTQTKIFEESSLNQSERLGFQGLNYSKVFSPQEVTEAFYGLTVEQLAAVCQKLFGEIEPTIICVN
jgi:predicted Zn-dependent peptidase